MPPRSAPQSHLLNRLSYNDEWDRFRLENEGVAYFGIKLVCEGWGWDYGY